jgi:predicted dehydrogenase
VNDAAPVRVGLVGLGYWGPNLARNFDRLPGAELRWCCDRSEEALHRHRPHFPSARFTDRLDDLLADPDTDAIVLATSVPTHYALARQALEAGKHALVEKPLAQSAEEARDLRDIARREGRVLMVGHLLRFHPGVRKLRELIESGQLGEIFYAYGNRQNLGKVRSDENALWSLGAHDISVLLYLLGSRPVEVSARGACYLQPTVQDVVFCHLRFETGQLGNLHLSWLDPHKMRRMTVVGSEKMAVFDDMETDRKVTVYDKGAHVNPQYRSYGEYISVRFGDIHIPRISNEEPLRIECRHFVEAVRTGSEPAAGPDEGVAVVEVLEALERSLQAGGETVALELV